MIFPSINSVQLLSHVWLFAVPWTAAHQASLSIIISQNMLKLMSINSMMPSNYLILCHPLLLLPSIFLSIRVFFNKSVLHIRWPKYWSFTFSICPSNEYSGLISFRMRTNQRVVTFKFHWLNMSQDRRMVIIISMQKHYDNIQTYFHKHPEEDWK